jgi:heme/copper-type cytochrome/quinol oxidase subunit 3
MATEAATLEHEDHGHGAHYTSTGLDNRKLAMWAFLGSECLLFGALISSYLLYRNRGPGVHPHDVYDIPYTSVSSFVLLMSSLTMVLALSALQRRDERQCRVWLTATALLGMTFIGGQVYEFTTFVAHDGISLTSNPASSAFFVLTGFHGTHVTLGIIMLLSLVGFSLAGRLGPENSLQVELVGLYWHFVDIVWVVIFTVVYLMPAPK